MNTTYFLNCAAGNLFRTKTTPAIPQNYYLGLSTTPPNMDGSGVTEPPVSASYQRIALDDLSQPVGGLVTNQGTISFPESTANWGTVTHYVIYDSPTAGNGNLLMYGALSTPRSVETATIMAIKSGYLKLSVKNED